MLPISRISFDTIENIVTRIVGFEWDTLPESPICTRLVSDYSIGDINYLTDALLVFNIDCIAMDSILKGIDEIIGEFCNWMATNVNVMSLFREIDQTEHDELDVDIEESYSNVKIIIRRRLIDIRDVVNELELAQQTVGIYTKMLTYNDSELASLHPDWETQNDELDITLATIVRRHIQEKLGSYRLKDRLDRITDVLGSIEVITYGANSGETSEDDSTDDGRTLSDISLPSEDSDQD